MSPDVQASVQLSLAANCYLCTTHHSPLNLPASASALFLDVSLRLDLDCVSLGASTSATTTSPSTLYVDFPHPSLPPRADSVIQQADLAVSDQHQPP